MSRVTVKDRGADELLRRAHKGGNQTVRVGILADQPKKEHGGGVGKLSLVEVAALHEFGAPGAGIPQRSFVRAAVDEHRSDIHALQERLAGQILRGEIDEKAALERLGAFVAGLMQRRIAAGIAPALNPETVARKGSSTPLVDTGQLRSSITWKVA